MVGFSVEAIVGALGGTLDPLLGAIKSGAIRGIGAVVGCNNPKVQHDFGHLNLVRELIKTTCSSLQPAATPRHVPRQGCSCLRRQISQETA